MRLEAEVEAEALAITDAPADARTLALMNQMHFSRHFSLDIEIR